MNSVCRIPLLSNSSSTLTCQGTHPVTTVSNLTQTAINSSQTKNKRTRTSSGSSTSSLNCTDSLASVNARSSKSSSSEPKIILRLLNKSKQQSSCTANIPKCDYAESQTKRSISVNIKLFSGNSRPPIDSFSDLSESTLNGLPESHTVALTESHTVASRVEPTNVFTDVQDPKINSVYRSPRLAFSSEENCSTGHLSTTALDQTMQQCETTASQPSPVTPSQLRLKSQSKSQSLRINCPDTSRITEDIAGLAPTQKLVKLCNLSTTKMRDSLEINSISRDECLNSRTNNATEGSIRSRPAEEVIDYLDEPETREKGLRLTRSSIDHERIKEVLVFHIDLEILLKHQELQRIEQELSKCQMAIDKIRAWHVKSFSGTQKIQNEAIRELEPTLKDNGPSQRDKMFNSTSGITNGLCSTYCGTWVYPRSNQDSENNENGGVKEGSKRVMRSNPSKCARESAIMSKMERRRNKHKNGRLLGELYASNIYARPYRKTSSSSRSLGVTEMNESSSFTGDPLVLSRLRDGKMVRLVCNMCDKNQFANVQGFINHYRIQHHYAFRTHEAAAIECGRELSEAELIALTKQSRSKRTDLATSKRKSWTTGLERDRVINSSSSLKAYLVHPFVKESALHSRHRETVSTGVEDIMIRLKLPTSRSRKEINANDPRDKSEVNARSKLSVLTSLRDTDFKHCARTPHLSSLLERRGFRGNLSECVDNARVRLEMSEDDEVTPEENFTSPPSNLSRTSARRDW